METDLNKNNDLNEENNFIDEIELENDIVLTSLEIKEKEKDLELREKKLSFKQQCLSKKEIKNEDRYKELLKMYDELEEEKLLLKKERLDIQKECESHAEDIIKDVKERNSQLVKQNNDLMKVKLNKEVLEIQLEELELQKKRNITEIVELREELEKAKSFEKYSNMINIEEKLMEVDNLKEKVETLEKDNELLVTHNNELESRLKEMNTLKNQKELLQTKYERLNSQIEYLKEIEKSKGTGSDTTGRVFEEIIELQEKIDKNTVGKYFDSDEKFVIRFTEFCKENGFTYNLDLIRSFISSIRSSRLTILKGYSGTGKSSLPMLYASFLKAECLILPVQPNWRTKQDIIGFYNYFTNKFIPTELTKLLLKANVSRNRIFFVVLDEMNLARVEYYFSEFNSKLSLSKEERVIELFDGITNYSDKVEEVIKDNKIQIPDNVYFIGTINEDDSVSPISDKIFDRAQVVEFMELPNSNSVGNIDKACRENINSNEYTTFDSFREKYEKNIDSKKVNLKIVDEVNKRTKEYFNKVIGFRSLKQIESFVKYFVSAGGKEIDGIDMQLVSKFVPKFKFIYSEEEKEKLEYLKYEIVEMFNSQYGLNEEAGNNLMIVKQINAILKEHAE